MRKFFEPVGRDVPIWLKQLLTSIRSALADPYDHVIRLWKRATADYPTYSQAEHEGAIFYDDTLNRLVYGNSTTFVTLSDYDASVATIAALNIVQGDLIYGSASETFSRLAKDTNATRYLANTGTSNNPAWAQVDLTNGVTGDLPFSSLAQGSALSVLGVTGNATADNASIAAGSDHQVLRRSGTSVAFGAVNLAQSAAVTGTLVVGNGGIGVATITGLMQGNGTSAVTSITNSTTVGQCLRVTGSNTYAWGALDLADGDAVTGILPVGNCDTGTSGAKIPLLNGANTHSGGTTLTHSTGISLTFSGNKTLAAWGNATAVVLECGADTLTDNFSAASATIALRYASRFGTPTFASTNSITVTDAATVAVANRPTAGSGVTITNGWAFYANAGNMDLRSGDYYRGGTKVVGARETGWTVPTGTAQRSGYTTYTAANISNPPTEAEVQAIADALQDVSRTLMAVITDLHSTNGHGLLGA